MFDEVFAQKLGDIVVRMQSITQAELGIGEIQSQYGNLSLTRPEDDATGQGHDHVSVGLSPSSSQPLCVSHMLNGPPPNTTYLTYARALLISAIESLERPAQSTTARTLHAPPSPEIRRVATY